MCLNYILKFPVIKILPEFTTATLKSAHACFHTWPRAVEFKVTAWTTYLGCILGTQRSYQRRLYEHHPVVTLTFYAWAEWSALPTIVFCLLRTRSIVTEQISGKTPLRIPFGLKCILKFILWPVSPQFYLHANAIYCRGVGFFLIKYVCRINS